MHFLHAKLGCRRTACESNFMSNLTTNTCYPLAQIRDALFCLSEPDVTTFVVWTPGQLMPIRTAQNCAVNGRVGFKRMPQVTKKAYPLDFCVI